jgi:GcrA cell cycle regulator
MAWTDALQEKLRELWNQGLPAGQIAKELGDGISRNAVIGKAHRLGLESRPSPVKNGEAHAAPVDGAPAPAAKQPAAARAKAPAKPQRTSLLELSDKVCKWPIGHPGEADFHFCGKMSNPGYPYCVEHCAVAYQAQLPRQQRPGSPPPRPTYRMR